MSAIFNEIHDLYGFYVKSVHPFIPLMKFRSWDACQQLRWRPTCFNGGEASSVETYKVDVVAGRLVWNCDAGYCILKARCIQDGSRNEISPNACSPHLLGIHCIERKGDADVVEAPGSRAQLSRICISCPRAPILQQSTLVQPIEYCVVYPPHLPHRTLAADGLQEKPLNITLLC